MDRLTLGVLVAVLLPLPALAQRVEIAVCGGAYQPVPRVQDIIHIVDCASRAG